jgi:tryptophanyl-tRNA synthetase
LLGTDNRKMSKSYGNAINLSDSIDDIALKTTKMITDAKRIRKTDPGHPDECNVFSYYKILAPELQGDVHGWCTKAEKGCMDCKKILSDRVAKYLEPMREKRAEIEKDRDYVKDVLNDGAKRARVMAQQTMTEVRQAIFG